MLHPFFSLTRIKSSIKSAVPCIDSGALTDYLNSPEVRTAIHIPESVGQWTICSDAVSA